MVAKSFPHACRGEPRSAAEVVLHNADYRHHDHDHDHDHNGRWRDNDSHNDRHHEQWRRGVSVAPCSRSAAPRCMLPHADLLARSGDRGVPPAGASFGDTAMLDVAARQVQRVYRGWRDMCVVSPKPVSTSAVCHSRLLATGG
jgi:hypothetical protein